MHSISSREEVVLSFKKAILTSICKQSKTKGWKGGVQWAIIMLDAAKMS